MVSPVGFGVDPELRRRRELAQALQAQAVGGQAPGSPLEALVRGITGVVAGRRLKRIGEEEAEAQKTAAGTLADVLAGRAPPPAVAAAEEAAPIPQTPGLLAAPGTPAALPAVTTPGFNPAAAVPMVAPGGAGQPIGGLPGVPLPAQAATPTGLPVTPALAAATGAQTPQEAARQAALEPVPEAPGGPQDLTRDQLAQLLADPATRQIGLNLGLQQRERAFAAQTAAGEEARQRRRDVALSKLNIEQRTSQGLIDARAATTNFERQKILARMDADLKSQLAKASAITKAATVSPAEQSNMFKVRDASQQRAQAARGSAVDLAELEALNEQAITGATFANARFNMLGNAARFAGVDVEPREKFQAISNKIVKSLRQKGEGVMSDRDLAFLVAAGPGLAKSQEANRAFIDKARALNGLTIQKDRFMQEYIDDPERGNGTLRGFNTAWNKFADENPLFDEKTGEPTDFGLQMIGRERRPTEAPIVTTATTTQAGAGGRRTAAQQARGAGFEDVSDEDLLAGI